jgi:ketosteroid isomerase-like protein
LQRRAYDGCEVDAVAQAFHDAVANQDAAALARYHEDARLLPPNIEAAEGRAAIQAAIHQLLDMGARSLEIEPIDVREAGDMTIEYGGTRWASSSRAESR